MNINIKIDFKKFFQKRGVSSVIAAVCAFALILTVFLFSRYVFDCVSVKNSVEVSASNRVWYEVYNNASVDGNDNSRPQSANQTYISAIGDKILVYNDCRADFNKEASNVSSSYSVSVTLIVKVRGNGNQIVFSDKADLTDELKAANKSFAIPSSTSLTDKATAGLYAGAQNALLIDLSKDGKYSLVEKQKYRKRFNEIQDEINKAQKETGGPVLRLDGELAVEFVFGVRGNDGIINTTLKKAITVPFTNDTFTIAYSGPESSVNTFPERNVRFPNTFTTVFVTLLAALLTAGLVYSLKRLFMEKDEYKRAVKAILRKYGDEIVTADDDCGIAGSRTSSVAKVKELVKFAQITSKPIICLKKESETLFYISCDGIIYTYVIVKKPKPDPSVTAPPAPARKKD